jgi:hypothetical protein
MAAGVRASVLPKLRRLAGWVRLAPLVPPVVGARPEMAGAAQASAGAGVSSLVRSGAGGRRRRRLRREKGQRWGPHVSLSQSQTPGPAQFKWKRISLSTFSLSESVFPRGL